MVLDTRQRFDSSKLVTFSSKVLQGLGVPKEDAEITAKMLVACDLRGVESHGIAHLAPFYAKWIKEGTLNVRPRLDVTPYSPSTAVMDGDAGLGFVAGYHAMMDAIDKAKKTGAGFVSVRNSKHYGAAACYAMMALEYDMIGLSMTVGGRTMMAPGSSNRAGGLNPFAVAVPAGRKHPFVLDMSTSVVAFGKIEMAARQGKPIPEGWVVDEKGNSVTDASTINPHDPSWHGGLLPLGGKPVTGGYKGFGMSVLVDILSTVLSGASLGTMSNHFFGAIRIDGFRPVNEFKKQMDELIEAIESLLPLPGVKKIYAAGGLEDETAKDRMANGVPLDNEVIQSLKNLSQEVGIEYDIES